MRGNKVVGERMIQLLAIDNMGIKALELIEGNMINWQKTTHLWRLKTSRVLGNSLFRF
jgi:hypothetical protein